jgi:mercuric ion transport protein
MNAGRFRQAADLDVRVGFEGHRGGVDSVVDYRNKLTAVERRFAKESRLAESLSHSATSESAALATGGVAALLAGACCVAPPVLVSVGLGGAWLAHLQLLEPYRPAFIGVALVALGFAGWRIYRPAAECKPGEVCAVPRVRRGYKTGFWVVAALLLVMLGFPYLAPFFY